MFEILFMCVFIALALHAPLLFHLQLTDQMNDKTLSTRLGELS